MLSSISVPYLMLPREPGAFYWLRGLDKTVRCQSAVGSSNHFRELSWECTKGQRSMHFSSVQVCRICLATDCRLYLLSDHETLDQAYHTLTGISAVEDILPQYACAVCAQRLLNCVRIRARSLRAYSTLLELARMHGCITLESIKSFTANSNMFKSNLDIKRNSPNQYDLEIEHVKTDIFTEQRKLRLYTITNEYVKVEKDPLGDTSNDIGQTNWIDDNVNDDIKTEIDDVMNEDNLEDITNDIKIEEGDADQEIVNDDKCSIAVDVKAEISNKSSTKDPNIIYGMFVGDLSAIQTRKERRKKHTKKSHLSVHSDEKPYSCDVCKRSFKQKSHIVRHFKIHSGEKPYPCDICKKTFRQKGTLVFHLRTHFGDKRYSCNICQKPFITKAEVNKHLLVHTAEKPYSCSVCNKMFNRIDNLKTHIKIHTNENPYSCDVCKDSFKRKRSLLRHIKIHSDKIQYVCDICNKRFSTKAAVTKHTKRHSGEKPFSCFICEKAFRENGILQTHLRTHSGEKPFYCKLCDKQFGRNSDLKVHLRIHTGEKPYSCEVCTKSFSRTSSLSLHKRVHTGEKPYSCDICQKPYNKKLYLRNHLKKHSGEDNHDDSRGNFNPNTVT